ncbi:MAG: hypothetical protein ACFE75_09905 [Candidatus Hodarchaeota archaeon]
MIFDDGFDSGHHMMDWDFGNWIFIILGAGIILLITIILVFVLISKSINNASQDAIQKQEQGKTNKNFFQEPKLSKDIREYKTQKANFCHTCGKKLDNGTSKYCPYCGVKI